MAGIFIGTAYFLLVLSSSNIWPDLSTELQLDVWQLESVDTALTCPTSVPESPPAAQNRFFVYGANTPQFFRIRIRQAPTDGQTAMYLGPTVDRANLIACSADGKQLTQLRIGSHFALSEINAPHPRTIFQLSPDVASSTLILRVDQNTSASIPIAATQLDTYLEDFERRHQIKLVLYGAVAMIVIYNLSLSYLLRNRTLLFNALTSGSMLILDITITGFGLTYFWSELPALQDALVIICLAGPSIFGPHFFSSFLGTGEGEPGSRRYFYMPWTIVAVLLVLLWFTGVTEWIITAALVACWIAMATIIMLDLVRLAFKGNERAAILLVPSLAATVPAMFIGATREYLGWEYGALGHHHTQLALVMEAVLFTLAVAYLIRLAQRSEVQALRKLNAVSNKTAQRLVEAIDEERTRISRDLHDTAGQSFVLIASQLGRLKGDKRLDPAIRSEVVKIGNVVGDVLNEVRQTTHDMYPPALDHLGIRKALKQQILSVQEASGISFTFDISGAESISSRKQAAQVFRILQELLNNVVKHSGADKADLSVAADSGVCTLELTDNGVWKDATNSSSAGAPLGIGLSILEKRVDMLAGAMELHKGDSGTQVRIWFPLSIRTDEVEE